MASTQQILEAMSGLQETAQGQVPVIPNNGNPGGAYNMASAEGPTAGLPSNPNPLAWLEPTEYMQNIKQLLAAQAQELSQPKRDEMNFNVLSTPEDFRLQPLDDNGMQLRETNSSVPLTPYRPVTNPNDIVLPESAVPKWMQGQIL
jgi:hypothetical protein